MSESSTHMEHGEQPLARLLNSLKIPPKDLVDAGAPSVTFKVVKKATKGRALTRRMQLRVQAALEAVTGTLYPLEDLFSYRGR